MKNVDALYYVSTVIETTNKSKQLNHSQYTILTI